MINTQIPAQLAADLSENQAEALAAWAKKHAQQAFSQGAQKGWDFGLNMDADGFEAMLAAPVAYREQSVRGILTDAHIEMLAKQYDCHNAPGFKGFARAVIQVIEHTAIEAYQRKHPDLIRIDTCWPNGMPDTEYITHDECRKRLTAFGDSHRQLMELKRLLAAVENAGPSS